MTVTYSWFLNFLLGNLDILDDLLALASKLASAATMAERWDIIFEIGKLILNAKQPGADFAVAHLVDIEALEMQIQSQLGSKGYQAQAWDGTRLRKLFDSLLPVLIQVLPILLK